MPPAAADAGRGGGSFRCGVNLRSRCSLSSRPHRSRLQKYGSSMNWSNVRLIMAREVRDQLRDRRTIFMIAVLPLLLYPLLGMSLFQISQFMREQATRVLVVGAPQVPGIPPL